MKTNEKMPNVFTDHSLQTKRDPCVGVLIMCACLSMICMAGMSIPSVPPVLAATLSGFHSIYMLSALSGMGDLGVFVFSTLGGLAMVLKLVTEFLKLFWVGVVSRTG